MYVKFPFSFRNEPWASFDKQSYNIFTDDFVHDKLFKTKVIFTPYRTWRVDVTESITTKDAGYRSGTDIKMAVPLWDNASICFRSKGDNFKVQYDHGLTEWQYRGQGPLKYYNLYGSYQSTHDFKNVALKVGANLLFKHLSLNNRIRVEPGKDLHSSKVSTGHKLAWANDNWSFDAYEIVDWKHLTCRSNAIRIGYHLNDNQFFLRASSEHERSIEHFNYKKLDSYFTKYLFDYVRTIDNLTKVGIETECYSNAFGKASAVLQKNIKDRNTGFKVKVSTDKSAAFCYQGQIQNYGKWTVGFELSQIGTKNNVKYGLQLDMEFL